MYSTAHNLWTFTWCVHFEKIHTERYFKLLSNLYCILYGSASVVNRLDLIYKKFNESSKISKLYHVKYFVLKIKFGKRSKSDRNDICIFAYFFESFFCLYLLSCTKFDIKEMHLLRIKKFENICFSQDNVKFWA